MTDNSVTIPLTKNNHATIDADDVPLVAPYKWHAHETSKGRWYARATHTHAGRIDLHRLIMNPPEEMVVDHINGDSLDCRRSNMRICTHAQNSMNQARNKPGYKGAYLEGGPRIKRWCAAIHLKGRKTRLGYYLTQEEAARAYDAAAKHHYGEFARLNFPE